MIITDKFEKLKSKIVQDCELEQILAQKRFLNKIIVFTNGCFDILHRGHVEYLAKAASYGHILIVGLNSDESVKKLKGPDRPLQDQQTRAMILAALEAVSLVVIFNEQTPYELIKRVQPDILIKGADYKMEEIVGYDIVKAKGGQVLTIDLVEGFSSTELISRMK